MKKKLLMFLCVFLVSFASVLSAMPVREKGATGGTFEGVAEGYHGEVKVAVSMDGDGSILSVTVADGHHETEGVGTAAIEKVSAAIVEEQSLGVDGVTGATLTGNAVLAASAHALEHAGLDPAAYGYTEIGEESFERVEFNPATMPEKAPVTGSISVTDVKGRTVEIDLPVSTYAVSTMDVIDYLIPLLGKDAFNKLVASGQDGGGGIQRYGRLYMPVVGKYMEHCGQISEHNAPFDLEMILAMDPDVLIVNSAMGAHRHAMAIESQLTEAGIPVVLIDIPGKSIADAAQDTLKILGSIFQKEERAEEVVEFLDSQYGLLESKNPAQRSDKPTVYYEKSGYSEVFGSTQASTRPGWGSLIAIAGGDNIADPLLLGGAAEKGGRGTIDPEYVIQTDPEFIILSGSGAGWMDNLPNDPSEAPSFDIVNRLGWKNLRAVKNGNVYELAHAMNRSIYSFYACLKLASIFYPEDFTDVNTEAIMAEFFDRFMLTDSDITVWSYRYPGDLPG